VPRRAIAKSEVPIEVEQQGARGVGNDQKARAGIVDGSNTTGLGWTLLGKAAGTRGERHAITGERRKAFIHEVIKVVVKSVAQFADEGSRDLQFASAATSFTLADCADATEATIHIKDGLVLNGCRDSREHRNNATAATATADIASTALLKSERATNAIGLRIATETAGRTHVRCCTHHHRVARDKKRAAGATTCRIIPRTATSPAFGCQGSIDRYGACKPRVDCRQDDSAASWPGSIRTTKTVVTAFITTSSAKFGLID
jgi:hypothetical protein